MSELVLEDENIADDEYGGEEDIEVLDEDSLKRKLARLLISQ